MMMMHLSKFFFTVIIFGIITSYLLFQHYQGNFELWRLGNASLLESIFLRTIYSLDKEIVKQSPNDPFLAIGKDSYKFYPELEILEAGYDDIMKELHEMLSKTKDLPTFDQIDSSQKYISNTNWKTFILILGGKELEQNIKQFPKTTALLRQVPEIFDAFFSILEPDSHIVPHRGPSKFIVRYHLGLEIPKKTEMCWIIVEGQRYHWKNKEGVLFDDTFLHSVDNFSSERRIVLFLDLKRLGLSGWVRVLQSSVFGVFPYLPPVIWSMKKAQTDVKSLPEPSQYFKRYENYYKKEAKSCASGQCIF